MVAELDPFLSTSTTRTATPTEYVEFEAKGGLPNHDGSNSASTSRPRSLRSISSSEDLVSSPQDLGLSSVALLAQFQADRAKQEAKFARLEAKARKQERSKQAANKKSRPSSPNGAGANGSAGAGEDGEEDTFAEAEAWDDLERLAKIELGQDGDGAPGVRRPRGDSQSEVTDDDDEGAHISVDEWRTLVAEDFQQSQFWYSSEFADRLAREIHSHLLNLSKELGRKAKVAFVCSPTAFVAFQYLFGAAGSSPSHNGAEADTDESKWRSGRDMFLLEIDDRFKVAARDGGFVHYDFNSPITDLDWRSAVDMVVIDPPFLNERTTSYIAETTHHILLSPPSSKDQAAGPLTSRGGSTLLVTGEQIEAFNVKTYPFPGQPPLVRTQLQVEHQGGRLSNQFGAWGSWEGAETMGA